MNSYYLPLTFNQLFELVKQLPVNEKQKLISFLQKEDFKQLTNDKTATHLASEKVLAKDWLKPEEDEIWKDL
jgi:hypothetical protein